MHNPNAQQKEEINKAADRVTTRSRDYLEDVEEAVRVYITAFDSRTDSRTEHGALKRLRNLLGISQP